MAEPAALQTSRVIMERPAAAADGDVTATGRRDREKQIMMITTTGFMATIIPPAIDNVKQIPLTN